MSDNITTDFSMAFIKEDIAKGFILSSDDEENNSESDSLELPQEFHKFIEEMESLVKEEDLNKDESNDPLTEQNDFNYSECVDQCLNFINKFKTEIRPLLEENKEMKSGPEFEELSTILPSLWLHLQNLVKHIEQKKYIFESLNNLELFCKKYRTIIASNQENRINGILEKMSSLNWNDTDGHI